MELNSVYDPKSLNPTKLYHDGAFYQYLHSSGSNTRPQYVFDHLPIPGQKQKSNLVMNRDKLMIRYSEVVGMTCKASATKYCSEQLQLFGDRILEELLLPLGKVEANKEMIDEA
ncbi:hypothetical protein WKK05_39615 (plasmid) [Nostoc sp. UHCC 0302]|uniref:hypothetical protein n=1 Tax=Nostoc sp. UHCC 0302 TaxID=3134896 RepID=UPI00311C8B9F